jgi:hypothetical protein
MDDKEFKQFLLDQIEEINKFKWIESEREHYDIGSNRAASEWIAKYARLFRDSWTNLHKKKD